VFQLPTEIVLDPDGDEIALYRHRNRPHGQHDTVEERPVLEDGIEELRQRDTAALPGSALFFDAGRGPRVAVQPLGLVEVGLVEVGVLMVARRLVRDVDRRPRILSNDPDARPVRARGWKRQLDPTLDRPEVRIAIRGEGRCFRRAHIGREDQGDRIEAPPDRIPQRRHLALVPLDEDLGPLRVVEPVAADEQERDRDERPEHTPERAGGSLRQAHHRPGSPSIRRTIVPSQGSRPALPQTSRSRPRRHRPGFWSSSTSVDGATQPRLLGCHVSFLVAAPHRD
jgi:hypothetical protein